MAEPSIPFLMLLLQLVIGWALVALFVQKKDQVHPLKPLVMSMIMLLLSLTIETFLPPFLFQGTVIAQWILFVLLGHVFCRMPLGKSMLAQFCFFSLMLGVGMLQSQQDADTAREEELQILNGTAGERTENPSAAAGLEKALLANRMLAIRQDALIAVYGSPEAEDPPPAVEVTPTPVPAEGLVQSTLPTAPPTMSGAEFEQLVYNPPEATVLFTTAPPEPEPSGVEEDPLEVIPVVIDGPPEIVNGGTSILADQMSEITEVKNRSTDKSYAAPTFDIGAVSIGERGKFAMVDGRLLREGAVLRTGSQDPRGWKLHQVTTTELFWQPLK